MVKHSIRRDIPGLGSVALRPLSFGVIMAAHDHSLQVAEANRSTVFTHFILSCLLEEPSLTPEEISNLQNDSISALVDVTVEDGGIREEFDKTAPNLTPQARLYLAYLESFRKLSDTIQNLTPFSESFTETLQPILATIREQFAQQQTILQQTVSRIFEQVARDREELQRAFTSLAEATAHAIEETKVASRAVGAPITQAGFWIPPSAPLTLVHLLRKLIDDGKATTESIRQAIVDYFAADDFRHLRAIVEGWRANSYFADRMQIISDALDAHINGKYTLSIPALLPLVEGILTRVIGRRATRADGGIGAWAGDAIETMYPDVLGEAYKRAVIAYVTGIAVYGTVDANYFTPQRYPEWLKLQGLTGDQVLQRHAILHGVQTDYASRENSLRAFFLLDVLSDIAWRAEHGLPSATGNHLSGG